ncbi:MAG: glycyl-radical enzyme activating protein [Clostridia bacterium]|nr:glycyl-radical enzyme activating protein [Clostridia bacterium]
MKGMVFDIQRFCIHDGPGIRTTVFFKGCPLRCRWCSNPESQSPVAQIFRNRDKCMMCGACAEVCPDGAITIDDSGYPRVSTGRCKSCGLCASVCPRAAIQVKGELMDAESVLDVVEKDMRAYESTGGGVTFSGGEPLMQRGLLMELLQKSKEKGLDTAMETSLFAPWETIADCLPMLDHVFCDLKHTDGKKHALWTGAPVEQIMDNMARLIAAHPDVTVRIPVIPRFNTDPEDMEGFADFFDRVTPRKLELLKYHVFGEKKYEMLGCDYPAAGVNVEDGKKCLDEMRACLARRNHQAGGDD